MYLWWLCWTSKSPQGREYPWQHPQGREKAFKNVKFIKTHQKLSISYQDNNLYLSRAAGTYYIYIRIIVLYIYIYAQQLWAKTHISCVCSQKNAVMFVCFFTRMIEFGLFPKETSGCIWGKYIFSVWFVPHWKDIFSWHFKILAHLTESWSSFFTLLE